MAGSSSGQERQREKTRRAPSAESVFISGFAGTGEGNERAVVRNDVYLKALDSARKILRLYHAERKRQL
jgi:hypothetical protein